LGIFGSGIPVLSLLSRGGENISKTIAGAYRATFSKEDISQLQDLVFSEIDISSLSKKLEERGQNVDSFFQDIARTTRGFDEKEFKRFVKELGLSKETADGLQQIRQTFGDLGNAVVSSVFADRGLKEDIKQAEDNIILEQTRLAARGIRGNYGSSQAKRLDLERAAFENQRVASRGNIDLGFSSQRANLQIAELFGKNVLKARQGVESSELEESINRKEVDLFSKFGGEVRGNLENLLKSGEMLSNRGAVVSGLEMIDSGNIKSFSVLKKLLEGNPGIPKELQSILNLAAEQTSKLETQSNLQREQLRVNQILAQSLKGFGGFISRLEEKTGQSASELLGKADISSSLLDQVKSKRKGFFDLADPSSGTNKALSFAAEDTKSAFSEAISQLPQSEQGRAKLILNRALSAKSARMEGIPISKVADRGIFALDELERLEISSSGLKSLRSGIQSPGGQKESLQNLFEGTPLQSKFGESSIANAEIKANNVTIQGQLNRLVEESFNLASDLSSIQSQEKERSQLLKDKESGRITPEEFSTAIKTLAKDMQRIADQKSVATVNLNEEILVTIQEDGKIGFNKFKDQEESYQFLKERLDNIERKISGKPDLPPKQ